MVSMRIQRRQRSLIWSVRRDLPAVAEAYADGLVGTDQVRRIAAVWANPRAREYLAVCEDQFLVAACELEYPDFDTFCVEWVNRVDHDGAGDKANRRWRRREVKVVQDFNGFWDLRGRMMSIDGTQLTETLDRLPTGPNPTTTNPTRPDLQGRVRPDEPNVEGPWCARCPRVGAVRQWSALHMG